MHREAVVGITFALALTGCPKPEPVECTEFEEIFVWADADGDGFGSQDPVGYVCAPGPNQAANDADCDDEVATVYPGAEEVCDHLDNDCNDRVDEAQPKVPWYEDLDGDGFGSDKTKLDCTSPGDDWILATGDCDDDDPGVNPAIREVCNGRIDDDCDGAADDNDLGVDPTTYIVFYADVDGDGFGNPDSFLEQCEAPADTVLDNTDCDDTRAAINPAGLEVCNHRDDDCDALTDDADDSIDPATQVEMFSDVDGDGYGDPNSITLVCFPTPGYGVNNDDDCDDTDPLAFEDQNWYRDLDHDGFGAGTPVVFQCNNPGGGLMPEANGIDCDDSEPLTYPDAVDVQCEDGVDQDCDGRDSCAPDCDLTDTTYPEAMTFTDNQLATSMTLAWNGTSLFSTSGGSAQGRRMTEYDAAGGLIRKYSPQTDFRSIFTIGDGTPELYARAWNSQWVEHWNGNTFVNFLNLTGMALGQQGVVVWDDYYGQYVASTDIPGQVPMFDVNGQHTQTVTLQGYTGRESQYPQGRGLAMAEGCILTYYDRTLSTWDQSGVRIDQATLQNAGTSFDSYFSLSYAQGKVWVVDVAGGTWRGYDIGL